MEISERFLGRHHAETLARDMDHRTALFLLDGKYL